MDVDALSENIAVSKVGHVFDFAFKNTLSDPTTLGKGKRAFAGEQIASSQ